MTTPLSSGLPRLLQRRGPLHPLVEATLHYGPDFTQALIVTGGSVTLDRRRAQRATCTLNVQVKGAIPRELTPLGGSIDLSLGLRSIDGTEAVVPMLTDAVITDVSGLEYANAVLQVQATERSERVVRWRFEQPYVVPAGSTLSQAVNLVLSARGLPTALAPAGPTLGVERVFGLDTSVDPWNELLDLCQSFGWRLWLDRTGTPRLDQGPTNLTTTSLLVLQPGLRLSSRPYNVIVGRWNPTDGSAPIQAIAQDLDPASPTFVGGPYGKVTMYFASSLPTSQAAADQAVQTMLVRERYQGAGRTWTTPFDPTLDPDDYVNSANLPLLPTTIVEAVTVDLGGGTSVEISEIP